MKRTLVEDALVAGLDDWSDAGWIYSLALERALEDNTTARALSIGLIAELIVGGFALPGAITDGHHSPWPISDGDSIARITSEWLKSWSDYPPTPGAIVWFNNTPRGDAVARAVLEGEAASDRPGSA